MPTWALALRLTGVGWFVAASVVIGIIGGYWIDRWLNTTPLFIIIGVVLGTTVAFYGLYQMVKPLMGDQQNGPKQE
jgi:F0F1-type ATP synthase assembly protein I